MDGPSFPITNREVVYISINFTNLFVHLDFDSLKLCEIIECRVIKIWNYRECLGNFIIGSTKIPFIYIN